MGKEAAKRACGIAAQDGPLTALVSMGLGRRLFRCGDAGGQRIHNQRKQWMAATGEGFATSSQKPEM